MKYQQPIYICAICGKQHRNIEDRIKRETACFAQHQADEEKRKQKELKVQKHKEIENAYQKYITLVHEYVSKYDEPPVMNYHCKLNDKETRLIREIMESVI
ncbi:MAG TPA: hypothetical protein DCW90_21215 [Lachnospiraceae bacterium]|nr:hypothetical protein [Lachnospiraceae bacterium]